MLRTPPTGTWGGSYRQKISRNKIENKGIAANTNAAAQLATGEYLALADHDDILAPHALYTMGKAILQLRQRGEPDGFLYSDEALFTKSIRRPMVAHFKPDYAPDYLLCCNYICHLAVFQKALWEQLGGERPECDGSQDHDLFLRLLEKTGGAAHVPQVLYWRVESPAVQMPNHVARQPVKGAGRPPEPGAPAFGGETACSPAPTG